MAGQLKEMSPKSRQYRHRNRQVPCDRCRQQKLRCRLDGQPPCQRCRRNSAGCTFTGNAASHNTAQTNLEQESSVLSIDASSVLQPETPSQIPPPPPTPLHLEDQPVAAVDDVLPSDDQWPFSASIDDLFPSQSISTQISQSLDQIEGHHYQLCGGSSDQDPWLLRHCKFDEFGFRKFFKVHVRNAGGVPTRVKIPAHFLVTEDEIYDKAKADTRSFCDNEDLRAELMTLVPMHHGTRLIRL